MAAMNMNLYNNSSSYRKTPSQSFKRSNTQASAYVVDASTMALTGFHFTTSGGGAPGSPSPPPSPSTPSSRPVLKARKRSGDAAYHIREECERLFCETLQATFLVEKNVGTQNSLVMDMRKTTNTSSNAVQIPPKPKSTILKHNLPTPSPSPDGRIYPSAEGLIKEYVEVWDYTGGARFRGFVAQKDDERSLFIFFDQEVIGGDLKPGLMSLLELASSDDFDCAQLVVCVDRNVGQETVKDVTRDLSWVGFELMMLDAYAETRGCISDRWLFLGMDV